MIRTALLLGSLLILSGCDLIRSMLPRNSTTVAEATKMLQRCRIDPSKIAWRVSADGTFAYGRKSSDASGLPEQQSQCISSWIDDERIKVAFIGWEKYDR
jgi:hypothetical protein